MYVRVCDICDQRKESEELNEIIIKDFKGWAGDFGCRYRVTRRLKVDVCDDCIEHIKKLSQEKQNETATEEESN